MQKFITFLLSITVFILYSNTNTAQTTPLTSYSSGSVLQGEKFNHVNPIKVMADNRNDNFITLAHYYNQLWTLYSTYDETWMYYTNHKEPAKSLLYLTNKGSSAVTEVVVDHLKISDFNIDTIKRIIYFCGNKLEPDSTNFVAWCPLDSLFDINSGCILTICEIPRLTRKANLTKIIFFENEVGLPNRIGLIARSRLSEWEDYFIDFKDSGWYTFYKTTKHHLLDIVKTENKVAVLGMNYYHGFDLFSHERHNTHYYIGRYYQVGTLIDSYIDPRIHFKAARSEKDHVVVISERNTAEIRLDVMDLNSMFYVNSQEILGGNT